MDCSVLRLGADFTFLKDVLLDVPRRRLLWALLALDAAVIALHVAIIGFTPNERLPLWTDWFRLSKEGSIAEIFEYLKVLTAAMLLLDVVIHRTARLWPVAIILLYLVADNAFGIHEGLSNLILPEHQNRGELIAAIGIGLLMIAAGSFAYARSDPQERAAIIAIGLGVVMVGAMAVGADGVHAIVKQYSFKLGRAFLVVEDGGELVAQSVLLVICWVVRQHLIALPAAALSAVSSRTTEGSASAS